VCRVKAIFSEGAALLGNNHRLDGAGRLISKYKDNEMLRACWDAALMAGIPEDDCRPEGSNDPRLRVPQDSIWSEFILRAFEAYRDKPNSNDAYPRAGFKIDLRGIAFNLDLAAKLLAEFYGIEATPTLIPLGWLRFGAELAWWRSEPGSPNALAEMDREFRRPVNRYPWLSALWCAQFEPFILKEDPYDPLRW
jgi:hypothetical protein